MTNPTPTPAEQPPLYIYHVEVSDNGCGIVCAVPDEETARDWGVETAIENEIDDSICFYGDSDDPEDPSNANAAKARAEFRANLKVTFWGEYQGSRKINRPGQTGHSLLETCEV